MRFFLLIFQQHYALKKKKSQKVPPKLTLYSPEMQEKMTKFLAKAREITVRQCLSLSLAFYIQISANLCRAHLLSAFAYMK